MKDLNLFKGKGSLYFREVRNKEDVLGVLDCSQGDDPGEPDGFLVRGSEKVCRAIIASLKDKKIKKKIAFVGGDDVLNRRAVESLGIDYLVSPERDASRGVGSREKGVRKDSLKQRDSGLNHVVARIAKDKGVEIVVDMSEVCSLKGKERAFRIARIMQNVSVCRKVGCGVRIASLASSKKSVVSEVGRKSFGFSLGMSSGEVRDCVLF